MRVFEIYIDVKSPQERVWNTLVDFENYGVWNTLIPFVEGTLEKNATLFMRVKNQESATEIKVDGVDEGKRFILSRNLIHHKLVHLVHYFELTKIDEKTTRFTQRWECTGLLIPVMWKRITTKMGAFRLFNSELKNHLESGSKS